MDRKIGVILSYVLMIFEVLSTLLLTPFIIRTLGQAEFGVYKLSAAMISYLLLLDLGVGNAVVRFVAKYHANNDRYNERRFLGVATLFYISIAIISVVIGFVVIYFFPVIFAKGLSFNEVHLGQKLMLVTLINSAFTLGTAGFVNSLIAYQKFAISRGSSIILTIIKIVVLYYAVKSGLGSLGIVTVNLLLTIIGRGGLTLYVLFSLKLIPSFKHLDKKFVHEIVAYSLLIFIQMITTLFNQTLDQMLIGALVASSTTIIAVYSIGSQIIQYYQSIGTAFTGVLMPGIVNIVEQKNMSTESVMKEMIKDGRIILMVMGLIWGCFLVCGDTFVNLWVGHENSMAYYVALILMSAYVIILPESVGTQVLWALNQHKEQAYMKLFVVVINIFLTVLLIKWNPLFGATIGTFISLFLGDVVVLNVLFKTKLQLRLVDYYQGLLKGILPSLMIMILFGFIFQKYIVETWLGFICIVFFMISIYCISLLIFGMNQYEKSLLKSILKFNKKL